MPNTDANPHVIVKGEGMQRAAREEGEMSQSSKLIDSYIGGVAEKL